MCIKCIPEHQNTLYKGLFLFDNVLICSHTWLYCPKYPLIFVMLKPHNSGGQPWYRSCSINDSSFSKSKGLNYLRRLNVEIWHNMQKFVLHFLCKMHHYSGLVCSCSVPAPPFHGKRCLFVVSPLTSSITWPECEVLRLSMSSQWKVTAEVLTDKHSSKLQLSIVQTIWDLSPNAFSVIIIRFVLHYYNYAYRKDLTNIHILRYRDCEKKLVLHILISQLYWGI